MAERQRGIDSELSRPDSHQGLQAALMRLTSPQIQAIQNEIQAALESLRLLESNLSQHSGQLKQQGDLLNELVRNAQAEIGRLESRLDKLDLALQEELPAQLQPLQDSLGQLEAQLTDPAAMSDRLRPVLVPVVVDRVRNETEGFAQAVAPVIGPAIRSQIRNAREDIIEALFPIIGEIIGKAISESMRELSRRIDTRMRQQLDFGARVRGLFARLQGVSEAELLLREALPYTVNHIFLVHRHSGLLLAHRAPNGGQAEEMDTISGMLTAIGDFVRDSFGEGQGELEEIAHGEQRILLEGGQLVYIAVVLEGVEPPGYNQLIGQVVHGISLEHEGSLRQFKGDMGQLPDLAAPLGALLKPTAEQLQQSLSGEPLTRAQKLSVLLGILALLLVVGLVAFACVYAVRLWPVVFP
jgi:hypothetical protein